MQLPDEPVALIVDDDDVFRERLSRAFSSRGWTAWTASGAEQALVLIGEHRPDLVLVDLKMPGKDGLDLIPDLRRVEPEAVIVVLTGYGSIATTLAATKLGADHYLSKPADMDQILAVYERICAGSDSGESIPASVPSLARVEWEHIQRVLTDCHGNITQAAKLLGIHRRSLQRKLLKYPPGQ